MVPPPPAAEHFPNWHKPEVRSLVAAVAAEHGLKPDSITSWIAPGFAVYLRPDEAARLKQDRRVTRLEQDRRLRWSALWTDSTNGGETTSWGTQAVAGPSTSAPGGPTVYIPDAGVGPHADLTNVTERIAVRSVKPVGCYAHATHVAGIVGAAANNSGVIGVRPSANLVSIALGESNRQDGYECSEPGASLSETVLSAAFDFIRYHITQSASRRVGIVTLSINDASTFAEGNILGDRLKSLATPAAGYPGAFIVQSAGNKFENGCTHAFDGGQRPGNESDGIMVVGAIDANGQPVVPLNGVGGFRNGGSASTEAGSNFGPCVEAWAPGNNILSTFASYPQVTNPPQPYTTLQKLSGTSMAAPHVAGVAAGLAAAENLQTPAQIETAVRARFAPLGSSDNAGRPLHLARLAGTVPLAQPTVEFLIGANEFALVNGSITKTSDQSFPLRFDSVGAQNCVIRAFKNNKDWYSIPAAGVRYYWGHLRLPVGSYRWSAECTSPQGLTNTASASATVTPPGFSASFFINEQNTRGLGPFQFSPTTPFSFRYESTGALYCDLKGWVHGEPWDLWYSVPNFVTSFNWDVIQLNIDSYRWTIDCYNSYGQKASASAAVNIVP